MKLPSPVPSSGALRPQHRSASRIGAAPQPHEGGRRRRILVLKLGALGNIVLSLSSFAAIRRHHPDASITLLTTAPYAAWMAESPWFDRVLIDSRPAWWDLPGVLRLRHMLLDGRFDRVYDLQTSSRSSHYFRLFPPASRPEWSGIAAGSSHPDRRPERNRVHDIDRQHAQLRQAGVADFSPADLSWSRGDIARLVLPSRFALLVPGSSPHRPVKRWPAAHYRTAGQLAVRPGHRAPRHRRHRRACPGGHHRCRQRGARPDRTDQLRRSRRPGPSRGLRGRQRHRADAPDRHRRLPIGGTVLRRFRSGPLCAPRWTRRFPGPRAAPRRPGRRCPRKR